MIPTPTTAGTIRRAILVFVPAALVGLAVIYFLFDAQDRATRSIAFTNEEKVIEIGRRRLPPELSTVASDLRYLAGQKTLQRLLSTGDTASRQELAANCLSFVAHKRSYDQIRLLSADGGEVVRVNWNGGAPAIVPDEELQDKVDRYYIRLGTPMFDDEGRKQGLRGDHCMEDYGVPHRVERWQKIGHMFDCTKAVL